MALHAGKDIYTLDIGLSAFLRFNIPINLTPLFDKDGCQKFLYTYTHQKY